jgi:uncharacterized membrane protein
MRISAENYTPLPQLERLRKRAFFTWLITGFSVFLWLLFIVAAPIFAANGNESVAQPIYKFFSYICHQIDSRSFHFFEHRFGVCSRCFGVYFGLWLGIVAYPIFRKIEEVEPLPRIWLFLAMIPIGIDWGLGFFEIWENTHLSRFITGAILGIACGVFLLPAFADINKLVLSRRQKTKIKVNRKIKNRACYFQ